MIFRYDFIDTINNKTILNLKGFIESHMDSIECLHLNISSLGGDVAPAITIYNYLKCLNFKIVTHNLGEVTSAAVIMYLAGNTRTAEKYSKFIMHPITIGINESLSYFKLQELIQLVDADIKNYALIVNHETNSLKGLYNVEECLKSCSITLCPESAFQCGIVTHVL